jgi:hypothetical protein
MTISDVVCDHMVDMMEEIAENYMDRLESPVIREKLDRLFTEMHQAISSLEFGSPVSRDQSSVASATMFDEIIADNLS